MNNRQNVQEIKQRTKVSPLILPVVPDLRVYSRPMIDLCRFIIDLHHASIIDLGRSTADQKSSAPVCAQEIELYALEI